MTSEVEGLDLIEAFVSHLEQRPGSLVFGSGKTLRPAVLRALLVSHAAQAERVRVLEGALEKVNAIRNSIIGCQRVNFSEHVYPLVAALNEAGFTGQDYAEARENVGTMLERTLAAEARAEAAERRAGELEGLVQETAELGRHLADITTTPGALLNVVEALAATCDWFAQRESGQTTTNAESVIFRHISHAADYLNAALALLPATQAEGEK